MITLLIPYNLRQRKDIHKFFFTYDVIVFPLTRLDINLRGLARSTCSENNPVFAQSGLNVDTENKV